MGTHVQPNFHTHMPKSLWEKVYAAVILLGLWDNCIWRLCLQWSSTEQAVRDPEHVATSWGAKMDKTHQSVLLWIYLGDWRCPHSLFLFHRLHC